MKDTITSVQIALKNELQERNFYLEQSKRTSNAAGRQMFALIAEDENEHYERLKKLHEDMLQQGKWPASVPAQIKNTNIMSALRSITKFSSSAPPAGHDDRQAVKTAIDFETKGFNFYTGLSADAETKSEKVFFNLLAAIEQEHLLSLQDTLLYFEDPAAWFSQMEKQGLDG